MLIPTLHTERLSLEPLSADCAALYERFYTDADASAFYNGPLSPAAAWARLASDLGSWHLQGFGVWALKLRQPGSPGELVGVCGFWQGKGWPRELTWWLLPEFRGRGLAQEASVAAIGHAYEQFGWEQVQTYTKDDNHAARQLVQRLGGQVLRRELFPDGVERHLYLLPRPTPGQPCAPAHLQLLLSEEADEALRQAIVQPLVAYNQSHAAPSQSRPLVISVSDPRSGAVLGGLWGYTSYGWLFTQLLVVPEEARGQGLGRRLLQMAEAEAQARGCHGAWLDTFEFQARGFYEKQGYRCFGELPDYPQGGSRFFMQKALPPAL